MGAISNIISEESNHLKNHYGYFNEEEINEVVEIAEKYHEDNTYDYKANMKPTTLAKLVKNLIIDHEANKDKFIIQALEEIYLLADINKDRESIKKTVEENKEDTKKFLQEYIDHEKQQREMMENNLLEQAEKCTDEDEKQRMIEASHAYTDGYTFKRFINYIRSDQYKKDLKKNSKPKHIKRLFDDANYIVSRVVGPSGYKMNFTVVANKINDAKFISLKKYRNYIDDFIIALLLHISKSVKVDNKSDLMYAYNLASNILHLFGIQNFATNFDKEKDKYFEEALDAFVELHTNNEANVG